MNRSLVFITMEVKETKFGMINPTPDIITYDTNGNYVLVIECYHNGSFYEGHSTDPNIDVIVKDGKIYTTYRDKSIYCRMIKLTLKKPTMLKIDDFIKKIEKKHNITVDSYQYSYGKTSWINYF